MAIGIFRRPWFPLTRVARPWVGTKALAILSVSGTITATFTMTGAASKIEEAIGFVDASFTISGTAGVTVSVGPGRGSLMLTGAGR
jgi:hypothetical protein